MNLLDVIGPIMIGPSSSHTAGAVRLGRLALALLGEPVQDLVGRVVRHAAAAAGSPQLGPGARRPAPT